MCFRDLAAFNARTGPQAQPVASFPPALRPRHYASAFLPRLRDLGAGVVLATAPVPGCDFFQPHNGILAASILVVRTAGTRAGRTRIPGLPSARATALRDELSRKGHELAE